MKYGGRNMPKDNCKQKEIQEEIEKNIKIWKEMMDKYPSVPNYNGNGCCCHCNCRCREGYRPFYQPYTNSPFNNIPQTYC